MDSTILGIVADTTDGINCVLGHGVNLKGDFQHITFKERLKERGSCSVAKLGLGTGYKYLRHIPP